MEWIHFPLWTLFQLNYSKSQNAVDGDENRKTLLKASKTIGLTSKKKKHTPFKAHLGQNWGKKPSEERRVKLPLAGMKKTAKC